MNEATGYAKIGAGEELRLYWRLEIQQMEPKAAVCPVFDCGCRDFDEIENVENGFQKVRIGSDLRKVNIDACK